MRQVASVSRIFDIDCRRCSRLSTFLQEVRQTHPNYYARPVPSFGDLNARLLIIGLAPGMHGANASGRPFTGDHAGILLYATLHRFGFSSAAQSISTDDGLALRDCRITNAVKCLPPANKPTAAEVHNCRDYLVAEVATVPADGVVLALGRIAHEAVLRACAAPVKDYRFAHNAAHQIGAHDFTLIDSYHCSRYNTQTGRLTTPMFEQVFVHARALLDQARA